MPFVVSHTSFGKQHIGEEGAQMYKNITENYGIIINYNDFNLGDPYEVELPKTLVPYVGLCRRHKNQHKNNKPCLYGKRDTRSCKMTVFLCIYNYGIFLLQKVINIMLLQIYSFSRFGVFCSQGFFTFVGNLIGWPQMMKNLSLS